MQAAANARQAYPSALLAWTFQSVLGEHGEQDRKVAATAPRIPGNRSRLGQGEPLLCTRVIGIHWGPS